MKWKKREKKKKWRNRIPLPNVLNHSTKLHVERPTISLALLATHALYAINKCSSVNLFINFIVVIHFVHVVRFLSNRLVCIFWCECWVCFFCQSSLLYVALLIRYVWRRRWRKGTEHRPIQLYFNNLVLLFVHWRYNMRAN